MPTTTKKGFSLAKAQLGKRPARKWIWCPFVNEARTDGLSLKHWEREDKHSVPYSFVKFNKQLDAPNFTDEEYEEHLQDPRWTREETQHLLGLCSQFDLRWPIIEDRFDQEKCNRKSMEDMKERYYGLINMINEAKGVQTEPLSYDADHERRRKEQLKKLWNRTEEQIKGEEELTELVKRIEAKRKDRERKAHDLQKLISQADRVSISPDNSAPSSSSAGFGSGRGHRKSLKKIGTSSFMSHLITMESHIRWPEFKTPGPHLRSQEMKLPSNIGQKKLSNIGLVVTSRKIVEEREAPEEAQDIVGKFTCEPRMNNFELRKCILHFPADSATRSYTENTTPTVFIGLPNVDRRTSIPPKPQSHGLNLWSIMRNCIGKELTRIPIPVNFNEPLSMLQRITEDLEYSYLLDRAAEKEDICERLAYVAAFAVSCYSATAVRTTKPFNPLLGETFEFDRRADLGWRSLVEQVSHHPPAAAHHVEGINWLLHQEFMVSSQFRGNSLSVIPTGHTHVSFRDGMAHFTFQKVTTTVEGVILDRTGEPRFCLEGFWNEHVNIAKVVSRRMDEKGHLVIQTGEKRRVWTANAPFGDASQYNFTKLAIEMNEPDGSVAPTDSRRRPDQRLMEDGRWDEANKLKKQLEERQRKVRKQTEAEAKRAMNNNQLPLEYHARWFRKVQDPHTGSVIHVVRDDEYWRCNASQDWSRCAKIF
uniref:Oxysterol-binding protein n=1 Tax=Globodera pallida TaxID=36090 RepID=A0A183C8Z8_GLOPA